ncbi:hypothetical protein PIB30_029805 [Stylosanthes scabra]|uniref:Uncharacterized protein n=1 Tax=Stylosanthes scabra TaxID=79078 RepID=A0ABU6UA62_9FABA|nr:hypothetical protein [Stylosanthes scabra]
MAPAREGRRAAVGVVNERRKGIASWMLCEGQGRKRVSVPSRLAVSVSASFRRYHGWYPGPRRHLSLGKDEQRERMVRRKGAAVVNGSAVGYLRCHRRSLRKPRRRLGLFTGEDRERKHDGAPPPWVLSKATMVAVTPSIHHRSPWGGCIGPGTGMRAGEGSGVRGECSRSRWTLPLEPEEADELGDPAGRGGRGVTGRIVIE